MTPKLPLCIICKENTVMPDVDRPTCYNIECQLKYNDKQRGLNK